MKKLLLSLFVIMTFVACSESGTDDIGGDDTPKMPEITLSNAAADFTTEGGSTAIAFISTDTWTAEVINNRADMWCCVSPASGSAGNATVNITAIANDTPDDRTATVVIKSGIVKKTISVYQKQKDALTVTLSKFEVSADGGEVAIEVGHNVEFDITIDGEWITQQQTRALETAKLTFIVAENTTDEAREGSITFTSKDGSVSQEISIIQETKTPNNQIWYTNGSTTKATTPYKTNVFGANIISNKYDTEKGHWVITFDGDITSIGSLAFSDCSSLTSITIPNGVTEIEEFAFSGCSSLISITIPASVTKIGYYAFYYCSSLASVTIPDSVTEIGVGTFYGCSSLTSITIPDGVTEIGTVAFRECYSLTSIAIPNSVTEIGNEAFYKCGSLISITIPDSVTEVGENAFYGCGSLIGFYGKFASEDNRCLVINGLLYSFARAGLTTYTIPNSVTEIGSGAFWSCSSLTSVTIPDSVTKIGYGAFSGCNSLTSITIPDSVTKIGYYAFQQCRSLTSLTIPNGVTWIGDSAFLNCSSLTSITISDSVTEIGYRVFSGCSSLTNITIPNSVTSIGYEAFSECSNLRSITIPDSVTSIGGRAFLSCSNLTSVYCKPATPPAIGSGGFYNNASDRKIYVPTASVDAYKSASNWSAYSSYIEGYDF